jgi:hypothetical protein
MKQKLLHYWFAMTSSCVQATAHSLKAWLAMAAAHAASDDIPAMHWKQTGAVVLFFWFLAIVDYLQDHPLPTFDTQMLTRDSVRASNYAPPPQLSADANPAEHGNQPAAATVSPSSVGPTTKN